MEKSRISLNYIAKILYKEILFRSISELTIRKRPERIIRSANRQMIINKIWIIIAICFAFVIFSIKHSILYYSTLFLFVLFFFLFFFLQVVMSFISHNFDILYTLPLSQKDISKVKLLTFFKIFDLPLILTPIAGFIILGLKVSLLSGIWTLIGLITSELLAVSLVFRLARFFYSKIAYSTGGWKNIVRMIYMTIISVSIIGIYLFPEFISEIPKIAKFNINIVASATATNYVFLYPFCFGYLVSGHFSYIAAMFSIIYFALSIILFLRTLSIINKSISISGHTTHINLDSVSIKPSDPVIGILKKDLKVISRSPGYFIVLLLPIINGLLCLKETSISIASSVLFTMIIVAFAIYSIETIYSKVLPIDFWTLTNSKTLFLVILYIASIVSVGLIRFILRSSFPLVGLALIPTIASISIITNIITNKFDIKRNLYIGAIYLLAIMIPCLIVGYLPITIGFVLKSLYRLNLAIGIFTVSCIELLVIIAAKLGCDKCYSL